MVPERTDQINEEGHPMRPQRRFIRLMFVKTGELVAVEMLGDEAAVKAQLIRVLLPIQCDL